MRLEVGCGESGVLKHNSGNISETRKDRGKVTTEGLQELTNALSNGTNGTILTSYGLLFPRLGFATPTQNSKLKFWANNRRIIYMEGLGEQGLWA